VPIILIIIGLMLVVTGLQDTYVQMGRQIKTDVTGGFGMFALALGMLAVLGQFETFRPFAKAFMALVIIAILLANPGFFGNLKTAVQQGPISPQPVQGGGGISAAANEFGGSIDKSVENLSSALGTGGNIAATASTASAIGAGNTFLNAGKALFAFFGF
jgi:hypothetical protein